jgi:hypothetical protein
MLKTVNTEPREGEEGGGLAPLLPYELCEQFTVISVAAKNAFPRPE